MPPVVGREAIQKHWFPQDGSRTTVTRFDFTLDELQLDGNIAYARGTSTLSFRYEKDGQIIEKKDILHNRLLVLERQNDDEWLISCNMWN